MRRRKFHKKRGGVPSGYKHHWKYGGVWHERKLPNGTWVVEFRATKRKHEKPFKGAPKAGFSILWGFKNVKQRAIKTGRGEYQTVLTGIKYPIKAGYKHRSRRSRW